MLTSIQVNATRDYPGLGRSVGSISPSLADVLPHPAEILDAGRSLPFLKFQHMQRDIDSADLYQQISSNEFRQTLHRTLGGDTMAAQHARLSSSHLPCAPYRSGGATPCRCNISRTRSNEIASTVCPLPLTVVAMNRAL